MPEGVAVCRMWIWLLGALLAGGTAYIVSRHMPPTYRASATLLVNATAQPNALTYSDVLLNQSLTQTYSKIATETPVLAEVIRLGHLHTSVSTLQGEVQASPVPQTQLITVLASAGSAEEAAKIANLTAQVFIEQQNQRVLHGQDSNALSVVEPAAPPPALVAPRVLLNTVLGTGLGFLGSLGVVALITYFDDTLCAVRTLQSSGSCSTKSRETPAATTTIRMTATTRRRVQMERADHDQLVQLGEAHRSRHRRFATQ